MGADALKEIDLEDHARVEVLGTRVELYLVAEKWDMDGQALTGKVIDDGETTEATCTRE